MILQNLAVHHTKRCEFPTLLLMCGNEFVVGNECARHVAAYHPGCAAVAG